MATLTLSQLRTQARQRANMENSTFVSDSELNSYINFNISALRDVIISKAGNDYFASYQEYTLTSTETYENPYDLYKVLWLEILGDDGYYYKMRRFEVTERSYGRSPLNYFMPDIRYRLLGDNFIITPGNISNGRQIRFWYVPMPVQLSSDTDTFNGYNGWEEWVILMSARDCLVKEESDVSQVDAKLNILNQRIESMADNRDYAEPQRIYDNEQRSWGINWP